MRKRQVIILFVHRKVYSRDLGNVHFEGNDLKGTIEAYSNNGELIHQWNTVAHNTEQFQSMTKKYYNELEKNKLV